MPYTKPTPSSLKPAFQRPYQSRGQRREADRRKHDEANDFRFLMRAAIAVGLVIALAMGFALKGALDREDASPRIGATD
jgi:hypothetical protein